MEPGVCVLSSSVENFQFLEKDLKDFFNTKVQQNINRKEVQNHKRSDYLINSLGLN